MFTLAAIVDKVFLIYLKLGNFTPKFFAIVKTTGTEQRSSIGENKEKRLDYANSQICELQSQNKSKSFI